MKRLILAATLVAVALPATAAANPPTPSHRAEYLHAYHAVRDRFGPREAGCNLLERRGSCHVRPTDANIKQSLAVLYRDLAPPPIQPVAPIAHMASIANAPASASVTMPAQSSVTPAPTSSPSRASSGSGLESCIIAHESGGNPQAVNGQYGGIGQWSPEAWAQDGGTKYSSSPTGASYSEQLAVLHGEGAAQQVQQQGQYDGCG